MLNKYLYALGKDATFRNYLVFSVIAVIICGMIIQFDWMQSSQLKVLQDKQKMIAQIPAMQTKIAQMRGAVNGLVLNGIVSDKNQPMAIINNTLVSVGQEIEGRKLISMTGNSATVCDRASPDQCIQLFLQQ